MNTLAHSGAFWAGLIAGLVLLYFLPTMIGLTARPGCMTRQSISAERNPTGPEISLSVRVRATWIRADASGAASVRE